MIKPKCLIPLNHVFSVVFAGYYTKDPKVKSNFPSLSCTAPQNGKCGAGRCAVACFWDPTLHSPRPCQRTVWRGSCRASHKTGKPPPLPALHILPQNNQHSSGVSHTSASPSSVCSAADGLFLQLECEFALGGKNLRAEGWMRFRGTPGKAAWHSVRMSRHGRGAGRARAERIPTVEAHRRMPP